MSYFFLAKFFTQNARCSYLLQPIPTRRAFFIFILKKKNVLFINLIYIIKQKEKYQSDQLELECHSPQDCFLMKEKRSINNLSWRLIQERHNQNNGRIDRVKRRVGNCPQKPLYANSKLKMTNTPLLSQSLRPKQIKARSVKSSLKEETPTQTKRRSLLTCLQLSWLTTTLALYHTCFLI